VDLALTRRFDLVGVVRQSDRRTPAAEATVVVKWAAVGQTGREDAPTVDPDGRLTLPDVRGSDVLTVTARWKGPRGTPLATRLGMAADVRKGPVLEPSRVEGAGKVYYGDLADAAGQGFAVRGINFWAHAETVEPNGE
jgi:hypothetical protein